MCASSAPHPEVPAASSLWMAAPRHSMPHPHWTLRITRPAAWRRFAGIPAETGPTARSARGRTRGGARVRRSSRSASARSRCARAGPARANRNARHARCAPACQRRAPDACAPAAHVAPRGFRLGPPDHLGQRTVSLVQHGFDFALQLRELGRADHHRRFHLRAERSAQVQRHLQGLARCPGPVKPNENAPKHFPLCPPAAPACPAATTAQEAP